VLYGLHQHGPANRAKGERVTLERRYHVVAISLLVLGIAVGGVSWALKGTPFWVATGVGLLLIGVGLFFAGLAIAEERKRKERQG
jgi:hypothetical protein